MSHMIFGVEKLIFGQKVENVNGPSYFTVKLSVYKTTSDMFRTIWGLQNKGTCDELLFCYTEVQSAEYHYPFYLNISQCLCKFYFKFVVKEKISSIFEFLTKFPL